MRIPGMINFTRAFTLAWERMVAILFQPFDLGKWFTIGFSAFLAGLLSGGNGFNWFYNNSGTLNKNWSFNYNSNIQELNSNASRMLSGLQAGVAVSIAVVVILLIFALVLLVYWLGARGQFLFLDNLARNRGAITWPWRAYAREGNSLFLFYLLYLLFTFVILVPLTVVGFFAALPLIRQHRWPEGGEIPLFGLMAVIYLAIGLVLGVVLFLFRELGVPLMFRHGLLARAAFGQTWGLMRRYPGSLFLMVLLRIALFVALAVVSVVVCCLSCCVAMLPYIGTIFLLPALIYIKCFTLDCLAQMGPEYDVWTVDVPVSSGPPPLP